VWPRCGGATRQPPAASVRSPSPRLLDEIVDEALKGIETDNARAVGHEIRERVDVIVIELAVTIVDDVLDAAYFHFRGAENPLDRRNYLIRRAVAFDAQACLRSFHHACGFNL